jgi:CheY-specific phosphatase CheX
MHLLDELLQSHLFINHYPMPLIRAIQEISETAFSALISDVDVVTDAPYLVNDQIIYGELFSLIPLESDWCRGTMMLQTTQQEVMDMIHAGKTPLEKTHADFRDVNELVNEITNLIWGKIKSEFFTNRDHSERIITRTQVPTLVNHQEKYISFGTNNPQLSFRYTISDKTNQSPSIVIFQKLVFNLSWRPEDFNQSDTAIDEFVDSGELELF